MHVQDGNKKKAVGLIFVKGGVGESPGGMLYGRCNTTAGLKEVGRGELAKPSPEITVSGTKMGRNRYQTTCSSVPMVSLFYSIYPEIDRS